MRTCSAARSAAQSRKTRCSSSDPIKASASSTPSVPTDSRPGLSTGITLYPFTAPGPNGGRGDSVSGTIPLDYNQTAGAPTCNYATYRQYLGCAFGGTSSFLSFIGLGAGVPVANNGSNINQVAINLLQLPGPKGTVSQGFYFPGAPFNGLVPANHDQRRGCCADPRKRRPIFGQYRLLAELKEYGLSEVLLFQGSAASVVSRAWMESGTW